jgi:PKD repeat protein
MTGSGQTINMRSQSSVNLPAGTHTLTITVTRLAAPSTVWVDDDYSSIDGTYEGMVGNTVLVNGYNAFDDIQSGIDAVTSPGTVNVLPGDYSSFTISNNYIQVLGEDGAHVYGGCLINSDNATGIVVDNLIFHGTVQCHCNDTNDITLSNLEVIGSAINGIEVITAVPNSTVYIDNCYIHGCAYGVYVYNDSVVITNPNIYDCQYGVYVTNNGVADITGGSIAGSSNHGIFVGDSSTARVSGTEIYQGVSGASALEEPGGMPPAGIVVSDYADVTVDNCCDIHDNYYGIYVEVFGNLTANGNNIYDNEYGVWYEGGMPAGGEPGVPNGFDALNCEENWWGHPEGPSTPYWYSETEPTAPWYWNDDKGDRVSFGIDYTPWLDGPCPGGDPVGASAKFKAASRTGEPGQKVQFTDLSTPAPGCTIEEWLWNFGDGSTSTEKNPFHIYNREGAFNVTLTVWDSCGFEQTITMKAYITIKKPTATTTVEPAKLGVSYLNIDPAQVLPNQEVTISANICNSGEERGTKTVSLMVNGEAVASQSVGVSGGSCQQVVFKTSRAVPGTYQVAIDGMTGEFSVLAPRTVTRDVPSQQQTGLGTAGIIAIIAVLVVLIAALIMVFKRD